MWTPLHKLKGEHAIDFAVQSAEAVAEIANDTEAAEIFQNRPLPSGMDMTKYVENRLRRSTIPLMRNHKDALITIFAANAGISVEEYRENADITRWACDIIDMVSDPVFRLFFVSAQNPQSQSISVQESIKAQNKQKYFFGLSWRWLAGRRKKKATKSM